MLVTKLWPIWKLNSGRFGDRSRQSFNGFNFKLHSNIATSLLCSSTDSQSAVHTDSQSAIPTSLSPNTIPILMSYFKSLSPSTITILMSHSDAQFNYNFHWEAFSLTSIGTITTHVSQAMNSTVEIQFFILLFVHGNYHYDFMCFFS